MLELNLFSENDQSTGFGNVCSIMGVDNLSPAWPDVFGDSLSAWLKEKRTEPIKTLSLFSGAGGLDIGFSDIGFEIVNSVEIEQKFCETLEQNTGAGKRFSNSKVSCIDIREFEGTDLGKIDFIIGGPPCQTFSAAGRRANGVLGTTDARGVLFREYVRLLETLSPTGFLFENVYGIIGAQEGNAWKEILQEFSKVGYKLFYRVVDAADYGVPQHRERLLIVGLKKGGFKFPRPTHGPDSVDNAPFYNAGMALDGVVSSESDTENKLGGRYAHLLDDIPPGLNYSFYTEEMGHPNPIFAWRSKFSDFLYKADPKEPVRTIKASGGAYTGPLHWENRFFKQEEYKRLQTFPDNYKICGNKQTSVKQIGNSVPPQLARIMALAIREQVFGTKFPFQLSYLEDFEELSFRKRKRELSKVYQKKAKEAINVTQKSDYILPKSHVYYSVMLSNFKQVITKKGDADFKVCIKWSNVLHVKVSGVTKSQSASNMEIEIIPRNGNWPLKVDRVILSIISGDPRAYTVAWKAFEQELINNAIKADLVQLNGYYQYTPKLLCKCKHYESFPHAEIIKSVVEENSVPEILTTESLACKWSIESTAVSEVAEFLRKLGYEIRNHNTNPQIDENCWLIPYPFPTLTPASVQLWKKI